MPQPKKTGANLLAEARQLLQDEFDDPSLPDDTNHTYRYPTSDLVALANNALGEAERLRPDLFLGQFGSVNETLTTANTTTWKFPIEMTYWQPVVNFIAGMAQARDDEFAQTSRAGVLLSMFATALKGT